MYEEMRLEKETDRLELTLAREFAGCWAVIVNCAIGRELSTIIEERIREEVERQWPGGRVQFSRSEKTAFALNPSGFAMDLLTGKVV